MILPSKPGRRAMAALLVLVLAQPACGAATVPQVQVTGPFTADHESAFENGIDNYGDPAQLEGQWLREWEEGIDARVRLADAIALVTITTVREDVDLDRHQTYRLVAHVDRERHGELPDDVTLAVRQGQPGFGTVDGNEDRLLNQSFVAFVKWVDQDGQIVPRWHLSPASQAVMRRVNTLVERLRTPAEGRRRVIIRETDVEGNETDEEAESERDDFE